MNRVPTTSDWRTLNRETAAETQAVAIAWAAGVFEGEGCISCSAGKNDIHACVAMTDEDIVRRFQGVVGLGSIGIQKRTDRQHRKPMWRWQVDGDNAETVVRMLLPHLGKRRTARAVELLERRDEWRRVSRGPRVCPVCSSVFCPISAGGNAARRIYCSDRCGQRVAELDHRLRGRTKRIADGTYVLPNDRKTHCKHGHEFTPENTRLTRDGARDCRACSAIRSLRSYHARSDIRNSRLRERRAARVGRST